MASFEEIAEAAHDDPVIVPLPVLSEFHLKKFRIYDSISEFERDLFDPAHVFEKDVIINSDDESLGYQCMICDEDPLNSELNAAIDWGSQSDFGVLKNKLLHQSEIKEHILETVSTEDLVILIIVDGLSFDSAKVMSLETTPVLVDGLSKTGPGYNRVIYGRRNGSPTSVSSDLLRHKGFYKSLGFTYWERGDEPLSTDLHTSIGSVRRISSFSRAIDGIMSQKPLTEKTYVQITRMGLDQDSHNRKEQPNQTVVVRNIEEDLRDLYDAARELTDRFRIFLTADHGILWKDQVKAASEQVCDEYHPQARVVEGSKYNEFGRTIISPDGSKQTGLAFPNLARELKNTEWGVHGGFSYSESLIPLIELHEHSPL